VKVLGRRVPARLASENSAPIAVERRNALYSEAREVNSVSDGTRRRPNRRGCRSVAPT
jgi:hypothetical protein